MRGGIALSLPLMLSFVGCQASDRTDVSVELVATSGSALSYFWTNDVTEIRYVRFPSYIGVADAKPVKILSVRGLSPKDDADTLALLDKADIGSWKTFYEDDRVSDGMHWTVEVVSGDTVVKRITGFNAEPPGLRFLLRACGLNRNGPHRMISDDD